MNFCKGLLPIMPDEKIITSKTDAKKKRKDGEIFNNNKFVELRPTMENLIKMLCDTILEMDEISLSEGSSVSTADLIVDVMNEEFDDFVEDLPAELKEVADVIYAELSERIDLIDNYSVLTEAGILDISQRRRKAMLMRRYRTKIMTARSRSARRRATSDELERRASRKARSVIRSRFTGNKKYDEMSPSEKLTIDKRMARIPQSVLKRMTSKMMPKVKRIESERLKKKISRNNTGGSSGETKDANKPQGTKAAIVKNAVNRASDRIGVGKVSQDKSALNKKKNTSLKEDIDVIKNATDINVIFEMEFVKKSDLPKK